MDSLPKITRISNDVAPPVVQNIEGAVITQQNSQVRFVRENLLGTATTLCGKYKCFYPLTTTIMADMDDHNNNNNHKYYKAGYVASAKPSLRTLLWAAYNFSVAVLQEEFGMLHTALGPPETIVRVSADFCAWLNQNKTASYKMKKPMPPPLFHPNKELFVQLVMDVEPFSANAAYEDDSNSNNNLGALFWGLPPDKNKTAMKDVDPWVLSLQARFGPTARRVIVARLLEDTEKLYKLLEAHPSLYTDFQILILPSGQIMHFDVDRIFHLEKDGTTATEKSFSPDGVFLSEGHIGNFVRMLSEKIILEYY